MSAVHNPEADVIAHIEQLELEARNIRLRVEHAHGAEDRRVLERQLDEIGERVRVLRTRLPYGGEMGSSGGWRVGARAKQGI